MNQALHLFGVRMVGATPENGRKLLLSLALIVIAFAVAWLARRVTGAVAGAEPRSRTRFWLRQALSIAISAFVVIGLVSIWFDDPTRLTTAIGLITAGLAFALQRVITATAGYIVILRGKTFNVGDRIVMGGVRGDVIALSFMQTKIMEMGQPAAINSTDPPAWVESRQFTGRIVTVSNDKVFDEPVYNYTYHFPYIWEEMRLPIRYDDDRAAAERILLQAAERHGVQHDHLDEKEQNELRRRYGIPVDNVKPRVFWRLTDNWLELAVRFVSTDHGTREIKDAMSRDILAGLDQAGIGIASATYEIVGVPALRLAPAATPDARPSAAKSAPESVS